MALLSEITNTSLMVIITHIIVRYTSSRGRMARWMDSWLHNTTSWFKFSTKLEEASTHNSAMTQAGTVSLFLPRDLTFLHCYPKTNEKWASRICISSLVMLPASFLKYHAEKPTADGQTTVRTLPSRLTAVCMRG